ncbi:glycoside hydrolase family 88 protein [Enterococcus ratti]|uniref:glycoside hydrolase family 88 protein n=1 Tax=Enterococcus ratti TaxID=150033 RepID=UPI0035112A10
MLTKAQIKKEIDNVYQKINNNLKLFETLVPAAVSTNYIYPAVENADWTDGFWIGMLHLAQGYQPNEKIKQVIVKQLEVFKQRLDQEIVLNHHDIGFLYSLSAVADYRENKTVTSKKLALKAADILMRRYNENAGIFQAWGDILDKKQQGRMIIDCNMNLPLLYFASNETGNLVYRRAAKAHIKKAQKYLIRKDYSTFHTYYMDVETGKPRFGATAQGFSDDSCWSRGQAWGIYGFTINYTHTGDATLLDSACQLADYYLAHLPVDKIAYWDLIFQQGSKEERDTSASAIVVCGLLELAKHLPLTDNRKKRYEEAAQEIMSSLIKNYPNSNGLLVQGVYSKPSGNGIDECTIWGDYFYFEALTRLDRSWSTYW